MMRRGFLAGVLAVVLLCGCSAEQPGRVEALAEKYAAVSEGKRVNKYMLHYLTHIQVDAFEHLLNHESDKERALEIIKPVMDMLITTWMDYVLEDDV